MHTQPFSPGTYQNLNTALAALDLAQNEQQALEHPGLMGGGHHNGGGNGAGGSRGFGGGPQYSDPPRQRLSFVAEVRAARWALSGCFAVGMHVQL